MSDDRSAVADLVRALSALTDPAKDGRVEAGARRYRYLELPDLLREIRRTFSVYDWAVMQQITTQPGTVTVTNIWVHASGEKITHPPFDMPSGRSPQEIGSAITYARRYSLAALAGLAGSDDDDAQTAQPHPGPRSASPDRYDTRTTTVRVQTEPPAATEAGGTAGGDPSQEEPPTPYAITPAQMRMLGAQIRAWEQREGTTLDQAARRRFIATMAGVHPDQLASAKNLTKAQASTAIDQLNQALQHQTSEDDDTQMEIK